MLCKNQKYLVLPFRDSILFQADGWSGVGELTHIKLDPSWNTIDWQEAVEIFKAGSSGG